ncbi:hypothetical protein EV2_044344 [Malus domestica]
METKREEKELLELQWLQVACGTISSSSNESHGKVSSAPIVAAKVVNWCVYAAECGVELYGGDGLSGEGWLKV